LRRRLIGRGEADARFAALERRTAELTSTIESLQYLHERPVDALAPTMAWIEQASLASTPLVSVVIPTRNRAARLRRAVESILGQSYGNFEVLIGDDGSEDDGATRAQLGAFDDPRIRGFTLDHSGSSAARNVCLEAARGELIAYLDDDNTMHPQWLKSVAWAFEQRPEIEVLYGAVVIDDYARARQQAGGELPVIFFRPFDRDALATGNLTDTSAIAHRAGLAEARFDPGLQQMTDWDLLVRLTADRDPLALPAIAAFYSTDAPDRLSGGPTAHTDSELVRRRARALAGSRNGGAPERDAGPLLRSIADPARPLGLDGWALSAAGLELVLGLVPERGGQVVECGSGESTIALARLLRLRGAGHVFALEHHGGWASDVRRRLAEEDLAGWATLVDAPLSSHPLAPDGSEWYRDDALAALPARIDLLVVDGPPGTDAGRGRDRYPALPMLVDRLAPGAAVVLDDVDRDGERWVLDRWETQMPFSFERRGELAVGVAPMASDELPRRQAEPVSSNAQESNPKPSSEFQRGD